MGNMCLTPIEQTSYEFHANRNKEKRIPCNKTALIKDLQRAVFQMHWQNLFQMHSFRV
jgi:hypothetical protein